MKFVVDTTQGTWHSLEDLVVVELDYEFLDEFSDMSDSERSRFAQEHGSSAF